MEKKADICFEVSWEVCNKVGGIYTVVKSKAAQMVENYKENYFLVGPYFPKKVFGIFEESPPSDLCKPCFDKLKQEGIEVHTGTWLVKGNPKVLLIDFTNYAGNKNNIKKELWDNYQIDTLHTEWFDFDEPVVWAYAAGRVIEELSKAMKGKVVAQFHEWLSGAGSLYLRSRNAKVGTVFTTHATMLGRTLASQHVDIYTMEGLNADEEAKKHGAGTYAKYLMERRCAENSHVFTTVSEITGIEAEKILGKKPDVLLFNGLDMAKFPSFEEASARHHLYKSRIKEFLMYYFFPYYQFDLDNTLIFFIAGRYEFHDKGVDIFVNALGKLNERMQKEKSNKTIVVFLWIPGNVKSIRSELLESKTFYMDVKDSLTDIHEEIQNKIIQLMVSKQEITQANLFDPDFMDEIKPKLRRLVRKGNPPLSTHELYDEDKDIISNTLKSVGLDNGPEDKVKIIFYPIYLTGADGLLDTSYYESMQGGHLGVFPSFYEPWGYTPLEAGALGVSSVTTDLAGFGRYLCSECEPGKYPGIFVLKRFGIPDDKVTEDLANFMYAFANFDKKQRIENKIIAQKIAATADWKIFVERYLEAHNLAVDRI